LCKLYSVFKDKQTQIDDEVASTKECIKTLMSYIKERRQLLEAGIPIARINL
jgi:hypothetical protein